MELVTARPGAAAGEDEDEAAEPLADSLALSLVLSPEPESLESVEEASLEDPVCEAPDPEVLVAADPAPVAPNVERKKFLSMHWFRHWVYLSVCSGEPSPLSHLATHLVVALAMSSSGPGFPKHSAWQFKSVPHFFTQVASGDTLVVVFELLSAPRAKAAKPRVEIAIAVNFIVMIMY